MTDDNTKEQLTVRLGEDVLELVESAVEAAERDPKMGSEVSKSMIIRHLINEGVENWNGELREIIPEAAVEKYEYKYNQKVRKDRDYLNKRAGYWKQNVNTQLTKFYDDEAPADPKHVRTTMQQYRDEARELFDDGNELNTKLDWLDGRLEEYEQAVKFVRAVPDKGFDRVSDEISIGADLYQLRDEAGDVVRHIEAAANGDGFDPDAIIKSTAAKFGVSDEAIETLIDTITQDSIDNRQILKGSHGDDSDTEFADAVDPHALGPDSSLTQIEPKTDVGEIEDNDAKTAATDGGESR